MAALVAGRQTPPSPAQNVRAALTARYGVIHDAYRHKDLSAILRIMTADYAWRRPDGLMVDRDEAVQGLKDWFARIKSIQGVATRIDRLSVKGSSALVTETFTILAAVADLKKNKHNLISTQTSNDSWILSGGIWRLRRTEIVSSKVLIDGKPVSGQ